MSALRIALLAAALTGCGVYQARVAVAASGKHPSLNANFNAVRARAFRTPVEATSLQGSVQEAPALIGERWMTAAPVRLRSISSALMSESCTGIDAVS